MPFDSSRYWHCTDELAGTVVGVQGKCVVTHDVRRQLKSYLSCRMLYNGRLCLTVYVYMHVQEIDADIQRLIFQGRVLDDDKKIDDYSECLLSVTGILYTVTQ